MKFTIILFIVPLVLFSKTMGLIYLPGFPYFPNFPSHGNNEEQTCSGPYEVWLRQGEAPNCDTTCATICEPCLIVFIQAPFGCYCKPGYARNGKGICIPIWQCNGTCPIKKS